MAAQTDVPASEPPQPENHGINGLWRKFVKKSHLPPLSPARSQEPGSSRTSSPSALMRRVSRKVVPGLPRAKTFKRQQSEGRERLEPTLPTPAERRAVSMDRRLLSERNVSHSRHPLPRGSAPDFFDETPSVDPQTTISHTPSQPQTPVNEKHVLNAERASNISIETTPQESHDRPNILTHPPSPNPDIQSITDSQYDAMIQDELEYKWILNLSMHFRDNSKREKFFVTFRETESLWRRVTISLDYRNAPEDSLEKDLISTKYQRDKSAKIYEAIRESLQDIQFYPTVTNLKLQTTDGRLHVHVVEDTNEMITYPTIQMVQHLRCRRIRERDVQFESHMSGFVYKVRVDSRPLIKKEIPGPDTVDEFLYEVNALNHLGRFSQSVIEFYGIVVDNEERVKGLLISYAEEGALIDKIYDNQEHGLELPWPTREKWAMQIVRGLSDIHESGFVQGDFTLSNIVIDHKQNAKIIDINRRGCPVGWEPPEATPLIESNQRISMYIGVKSDLYQLGMVLWALAMLEDEPEAHRRPLRLSPEIAVPSYYRRIVECCLQENPRFRKHAKELLEMFPEQMIDRESRPDQDDPSMISVDYDDGMQEEYHVERNSHPHITPIGPRNDWGYPSDARLSPGLSEDPYYYPGRGRSPPSRSSSRHDQDLFDQPGINNSVMWPTTVDTYTGITKPFLDGPSETPMEAADRMVQDLENIEAGLQDEQAGELAPATGGESQAVEAAIGTVETQAPGSTTGKAREGGGPAEEDASLQLGRARLSTNAAKGTGGTRSLTPARLVEGSMPFSNQEETTGASTSRDKGKGKMVAPARREEDEDEEMGSSNGANNYTHDRRTGAAAATAADIPTRTTEADHADNEPRSRRSPNCGGSGSGGGGGGGAAGEEQNRDLAGVGSALDKQADFRQPACSDEDLGLGPNLTHDVTSMA